MVGEGKPRVGRGSIGGEGAYTEKALVIPK